MSIRCSNTKSLDKIQRSINKDGFFAGTISTLLRDHFNYWISPYAQPEKNFLRVFIVKANTTIVALDCLVDEVWVGGSDELLLTLGRECLFISNNIYSFKLPKSDHVLNFTSSLSPDSRTRGWISTKKFFIGLEALNGRNCKIPKSSAVLALVMNNKINLQSLDAVPQEYEKHLQKLTVIEEENNYE